MDQIQISNENIVINGSAWIPAGVRDIHQQAPDSSHHGQLREGAGVDQDRPATLPGCESVRCLRGKRPRDRPSGF